MKIIDSQVHLWKADTPDRPWPTTDALKPQLASPLSYDAMLAMMDEAGVDAAVIVPPSWEGDRIDYALEAAQRHPSRFAVMGRLALSDANGHERLRTWKSQQGMLGVRLTFVLAYDRDQLEAGSSDWYWPAAEEFEIPTMVLAPESLPKIAAVAQAHPRLKLIIDHMGLSQRIAKEGQIGEAMKRVLPLAKFPNVFVKVSGLPDYSAEAYPFHDMQIHIRRAVEAFGPRRCFWGTDVSRLLKKCSYRECLTFFTNELDFLSSGDRAWIMGRALAECLGWTAMV